MKAKIKVPRLAWMFENCFPCTLDTSVSYCIKDTKLNSFVITNDIDAMWLRDSTAQVWLYLPLTKSENSFSHVNTYPSIAIPWGMNFWTPQSRKNGDGWQYVNKDYKLQGFKQIHQPSPWMNDYGQFTILPMSDKMEFDQEKRASWYSHKAEITKPYYYSVYLADYDVTTEITPTERDAMFRFTFPEKDKSYVLVDAFDRGSAQAWQNLKEVGEKDFETVKQEGCDRWNEVLGKIEIEGADLDQQRTLYFTFYRSTLFPRKFYEIDAAGNTIHYSPYNGEVLPGYMYTETGFWETFRAFFPFLNLVYPSINTEIQEGLVNTYKESGFLPEWASPSHCIIMIGNNSASVVADAYIKGLRGYDIETLYEAILHGTENVHPKVSSTGRLGHEYYNTLDYVPYDVGINENFAKRSQNYRDLYSPKHKLMHGRNKDGSTRWLLW